MLYCMFVLGFTLWMIYRVAPEHGTKNPMVYISICSLVGSVSVMAVKGFGVALKLTFAGNNQLWRAGTWIFAFTVVGCIAVQMNYFNKVRLGTSCERNDADDSCAGAGPLPDDVRSVGCSLQRPLLISFLCSAS